MNMGQVKVGIAQSLRLSNCTITVAVRCSVKS